MAFLRSTLLMTVVCSLTVAGPTAWRRYKLETTDIPDILITGDVEEIPEFENNHLSSEQNEIQLTFPQPAKNNREDSLTLFEAILSKGEGKKRERPEHQRRHNRKTTPRTITPLNFHNTRASSSNPSAKPSVQWNLFTSEQQEKIPMNISELRPTICSVKPFQQTISHAGCESVIISNNMCYGQCDSFYIPVAESKLVTCSSCAPSRSEVRYVELKCPDSESEDLRIVSKLVEIIHKCDCLPCPTWRTR